MQTQLSNLLAQANQIPALRDATSQQIEALTDLRDCFFYEIHAVRLNDDGTFLLHHAGRGCERGTVRVRQWTMLLDGGLVTV